MILGAFFVPVYAAVSYNDYTNETADTSMIVKSSWLDEGLLRIDVLDTETDETSSLAIRLSDFVSDATNKPYIFVQAVDLDGNLSGIIQISNPLYYPVLDDFPVEEDITNDNPYYDNDIEHADNSGLLTPDGTGTVIDNVVTQNEIEFFTVFTEDGGEFFLVVDRQGNMDNVHLLNAVTLDDLASLAQPNENTGGSVSAIPTPPLPEPPAEEQIQSPTQMPEPEAEEEQQVQNSGTGNNSNLVIIIVVFVIVGGVAYYFKVVKGKNNDPDSDEDEEDDSDFMFMDDDEDNDMYSLDEGGDDE